MPQGLTYVRGRVEEDIVEFGTLTREAGQFTSPFLSCPVRSSGSHRVAIPVGSKITATTGAVVIFCNPDNNYNAGGQQSFGRLFSWAPDANNDIIGYYHKSNAEFTLERKQGGSSSDAGAGKQFTAGEALAIYFAWDATKVYVAVNGGTIEEAANTLIPSSMSANAEIGSDGASAAYFDAAYGAVAIFDAPLTQEEWESFAALRAERPPCYGEIVDSQMSALWYGAHSLIWSLSATGAAIDLHHREVDREVYVGEINGAGLAPLQHRRFATPLRHGTTDIDTFYRERKMSILMYTLSRTTFAHMWDLRRQVIAALNPAYGEGVLTFAPASIVYEINTKVDEEGIPYSGGRGSFLQVIRLPMLSTDPFWRVAARVEADLDIEAGGLEIPLTIPLTIGVTEVGHSPSYDGDVDSYPIIEVTALEDSTGPYLENTTSGKVFFLPTLEMSNGQVLVVDMEERTALLDGESVFGYRGDSSRAWPIVPGANTLAFGLQAGSASVKVRYYRKLVGV